ncbi:MAG TPA: 2OG-Fe(II) oxygenase family protein [Allosphingosinicella sp.]|nr:2OG-Fe(II) oxygenase family protein [Allosphingosinicella sp.]
MTEARASIHNSFHDLWHAQPMNVIPLFELNPAVDRAALAYRFATEKRVQIRNFLTEQAAQTVHGILSRETPWGLAWQAGNDGPHGPSRERLAAMSAEERGAISARIGQAMQGRDYAFLYGQYRMLDAYLERRADHEGLDLLVEHINSEPFLDLIREVTGLPELVKGDAQATLYAPGHFLAQHDDSHVAEGWRIAYVMNFCREDWRPDWGGYLLFYDAEGDVIAGFRPRFNALNLFLVPQKHNVTYVPPFAPSGRFAITGWFRDR